MRPATAKGLCAAGLGLNQQVYIDAFLRVSFLVKQDRVSPSRSKSIVFPTSSFHSLPSRRLWGVGAATCPAVSQDSGDRALSRRGAHCETWKARSTSGAMRGGGRGHSKNVRSWWKWRGTSKGPCRWEIL